MSKYDYTLKQCRISGTRILGKYRHFEVPSSSGPIQNCFILRKNPKFGIQLQILVTIPHINFNDNAAGGNRSLLCRQSDYKHEELATLEDETTKLSRKVGSTVPSDVASYPSRMETSD